MNALHYDFAAMLARNLQAGVLTELSWPALEKAMADFWKRRLFKKDKPIKFFESYPGVVALIEDSLVAVEGESVVATYIHPDRDSVIRAGYVGDALYCMSAEDETVSGEWSHGQAMMVRKTRELAVGDHHINSFTIMPSGSAYWCWHYYSLRNESPLSCGERIREYIGRSVASSAFGV